MGYHTSHAFSTLKRGSCALFHIENTKLSLEKKPNQINVCLKLTIDDVLREHGGWGHNDNT